MKQLKLDGVGQVLMRVFSILFSVFFVIILFNTVFFNKTIAINYSIFTMLIGVLIVYLFIFLLYYLYDNKKLNFLSFKIDKIKFICIIIIIFIIQYIFAALTYYCVGWDCGGVVSSAVALLNGESFNVLYYSQYPNNIGMLLLIKYVFVIANFFTEITTLYDGFFSAIVFNIIMIDCAAIFTFFTVRKVLGDKCSFLSLIFIIPFMIFSPYMLVPYTDTITMLFPIMLLYFYILIKELPKKSLKRYILILLTGFSIPIGMFIKPTVIIIPIAIAIYEFLNINVVRKYKIIEYKNRDKKFLDDLINLENTAGLKHVVNLIIVLLVFLVGFSFAYIGYSKLKEKTLGSLISQEQYDDNSVSFTHFLMMGMQQRDNVTKEDGKNRTLYGAYDGMDVKNTVSIKGYKEKQKYNLQVIKERLSNFGFLGYVQFLYNKANWILCDGTFFYGQEGTWRISEYCNESQIAKVLQQFIDHKSNMYKNITASIMQIMWILLIIGLVFSLVNKENKYISIGKLSMIGIIAFVLLFEGRSRYLINHIPIFIFVGTFGLTNSFKNLLLTLKHK